MASELKIASRGQRSGGRSRWHETRTHAPLSQTENGEMCCEGHQHLCHVVQVPSLNPTREFESSPPFGQVAAHSRGRCGSNQFFEHAHLRVMPMMEMFAAFAGCFSLRTPAFLCARQCLIKASRKGTRRYATGRIQQRDFARQIARLKPEQ